MQTVKKPDKSYVDKNKKKDYENFNFENYMQLKTKNLRTVGLQINFLDPKGQVAMFQKDVYLQLNKHKEITANDAFLISCVRSLKKSAQSFQQLSRVFSTLSIPIKDKQTSWIYFCNSFI